EQAPGRAKAADKIDAMREFASQHGLAALIVQVSVAALPREIAGRIVGVGIKTAGFRVTQATALALPDGTSTDAIAKRVRGGFATGSAGLAGHRGSDLMASRSRDLKMGFKNNVSIDRFRASGRPSCRLTRTFDIISRLSGSD